VKNGLLKCYSVPESLIHISGSISDMFNNLFTKYAPGIEIEAYDVMNGNFPDIDGNLQGFLITGSPHSAYEDEAWILELKQFIQHVYNRRKKIVGVCFGHQIIAEALGGKVARFPKGWGIGVQPVHVNKTMEWMKPINHELNLLVSYQDQIEILPPNSTVLASNSHCSYFMYEVENIVLGIQGHPEFDKKFVEVLYKSRVESLGQDIVSNAISSLHKSIHSHIFAKWINNFFQEG